MSLAAQFYVSEVPREHEATIVGHGGRRRQLYQSQPPSASLVRSDVPLQSAQPLLDNFRGASEARHNNNYNNNNSDMMMTDAERERFAHELDTLERAHAEEASLARQQRRPSTSLEQHFDPHLLADSTAMVGARMLDPHNQTTKSAEDKFFDKNERWRDHVLQKNYQLQEELRAQQQSECTFRPAINRSRAASSHHQNYSAAHSDLLSTADPTQYDAYADREDLVEDRLLRFQRQKEQRRAMLAQEVHQREETKCTFRPKTVKWTANVTPRYLDEPGKSNYSHHQRNHQSRSAAAFEEPPTFHPTTNDCVVGFEPSGRFANYVQTPVHLRLHREAVDATERKRRQEELARRDNHGRGSAKWTVADTTILSSIGAATADQEHSAVLHVPSAAAAADAQHSRTKPKAFSDAFEKRMQEKMREKEKHLNEIRDEKTAQCTFRPLTVEYKRSDGSVPRTSKSPEVAPEDRFTFTPRIDKRSAEIAVHRSVDDLLAFQKNREQKVSRLQEEAKDIECDGVTFTPRISKYAQAVEGKIAQNTSNIEDYRRFVAMQRRIRQRDIEQHLRERSEADLDEQRELTFRPEVHEAPSYIQQIVKELRENKKVASASGNTSKTPVRQRR